MRRALAGLLLLAVLWLGTGTGARAHEGPPFPIVVDQRAGPYVVSIWTDPDIGTGTFFVILESAAKTELSEEIEVEVCVRPLTGRLEEACYPAKRQNMRGRVQYYGEVEFDRQEMWGVRVKVSGPEGKAEVNSEVEATPPGYGRWDLLVYGFPFLLIGLLWGYAALRRGFRREETAPPGTGQKS
jgi:hypothetical protein